MIGNVGAMGVSRPTGWRVFLDGLWTNNPIFVMVLGICSSLAVTTIPRNAMVMYLGVLFATVMTSTVVSLIRKRIPPTFRMIVFMMTTSTLVIVFDRFLRVFLPGVSRELGPYVGLIITNCLVMGRAEAFASRNPPMQSALDAAGAATGYGLVMVGIAIFRELSGIGTFFGIRVLPESYVQCGLIISAPGGFLFLACLLFMVNTVRESVRRNGE